MDSRDNRDNKDDFGFVVSLKDFEELQNDKKVLMKEMQSHIEFVEKLKLTISELEKSLEHSKKEQEEKNKEHEEKSREQFVHIERATHIIEQSNLLQQKMSNTISDMENKIQSLEKTTSNLESESSALKEEIKKLNSDMTDKDSLNHELKKSNERMIEAKKEELEDLKRDFNNKLILREEEIKNYIQLKSNLELELSILKKETESLKQETEVKASELQALASHHKILLDQMTKEIQDLNTNKLNSELKLSTLEKESEMLKQENQVKNVDFQALKSLHKIHSDQMTKEVQNLNEINSNLASSISTFEKEVEILKQENALKNAELQDLESRYNNKIDALEKSNQELHRVTQLLDKHKKLSQQKNIQLKEKARFLNEKYQIELLQLQALLSQKQIEVNHLRNTINEFHARIDGLKIEISKLDKRNIKDKKKIKTLQERNRKKAKRINELQHELKLTKQTHAHTLRRLGQENRRRETELMESNLALSEQLKFAGQQSQFIVVKEDKPAETIDFPITAESDEEQIKYSSDNKEDHQKDPATNLSDLKSVQDSLHKQGIQTHKTYAAAAGSQGAILNLHQDNATSNEPEFAEAESLVDNRPDPQEIIIPKKTYAEAARSGIAMFNSKDGSRVTQPPSHRSSGPSLRI